MTARRRRRRAGPVPAQEMLGRWRPGSRPQEAGLDTLRAAWPGVVGAAASAESVPLALSKGETLTVACTSSTWAQELAAAADVVLARIREVPGAPAVARVRFAVNERAAVAVPQPIPPPPRRPAPPTPEAIAAAERLVGPVSDPRLRELLIRAAAVGRAPGNPPKSA